MAAKDAKVPRYKFQIPSAEEVDQPAAGLKKGSVFSSLKRPANSEDSQEISAARGGIKVSSIIEPHQSNPTEANTKTTDLSQKIKEKDSYLSSTEIAKRKNNDGKIEVTEPTAVDKRNDVAVEKEEMAVEKDRSKQTPSFKSSSNSIIVSARQRGNPVLKHIRNVAWEFGEIVPDYVLGQKACALFLSLRYHNFNPEYIHDRLKHLGNSFELRILLVLVNVKDPHSSLKELSKICILANCTLILSWSNEEAGRYLETYKVFENKPADVLQERVDGDYQSKMIDCLTSVKSVNKTDAVTLMANFGSLQGIVNASKEEISLCPGFGPQKAERLNKVFHEPFIKSNNRLKKTGKATEKEKTSE
ncbi:DNA excision repair protein ERCC-1-like isoform X2 [Rhopilema esculentum]|uniref:DNA excision repair protein ERCC-1-like isoform X2 n=1 Tax=Rhopilema esculentum TaxID=499914 RepID=UPI0031E450CA